MNYLYRYVADKGHLRMAVVHPETFNVLWKIFYPAFIEDKATGDLVEDDTIIEMGVMKNTEDVAGLECYLKSCGILSAEDTLTLSTEESFSRVTEKIYDNGGSVEKYADVKSALGKYGWSIKETDKGIDLYNRSDKKVSSVIIKGSKYQAFNNADEKIMSGNGQLATSLEKMATQYFYASPLK